MQARTPMTLFDSAGRSVLLYTPSTMSQEDSFPAPIKPAPQSPWNGSNIHNGTFQPQPGPNRGLPRQPAGFSSVPSERVPQRPSGEGFTVFVSNLPAATSDKHLFNLLSRHGTVLDCRIVAEKGQCSTGYVQFSARDMAEEAVEAVNGMVVEDGRAIYAEIMNKNQTPPSPDVIVTNVPLAWRYADLHSAFSPYGRIVSHTILKDALGKSEGTGHVRFASVGEAAAAIQAFGRRSGGAHGPPLVVRYADPTPVTQRPPSATAPPSPPKRSGAAQRPVSNKTLSKNYGPKIARSGQRFVDMKSYHNATTM